MGVKDLNNIVRKQPVANKNMPQFDTLVIDGSNLIITFVLSAASDLQRKAPKTKYNTINRNMLYQMKYIVEIAKSRGVDVLNQWLKRFRPNTIYFSMDPQKGVNYKLTTDMDISTFAREFLFNGVASVSKDMDEPFDLKSDESVEEIEFDLKTEEQEARKKASSKKPQLIEMYDKLKTDTDDTLATLYRQSFHFMEPCNAIALGRMISSLIFMEFDRMHPGILHVIAAEDEADLVIKNIGEKTTQPFSRKEGEEEITVQPKTLICSADTDYFILFSNNPNVYITGLHAYDKVYSPIEQWRLAFTVVYEDGSEEQLIKDNRIFDYVIRLAPLFGNDYNRQTIISAKKYENALAVFYPISTANTISKRSGIGKLIAAEKHFYSTSVISAHKFDRLIYDYMLNHAKIDFKRYLYSVFVYKNYSRFGTYHDVDISVDETELIKNIFDKWSSHPDPEGKYTVYDLINAGKYHRFYSWNYDSDTLEDYEELPTDMDELVNIYNGISIDDILTTSVSSSISEELLDELLENAQETSPNKDEVKPSINTEIIDELLDIVE
jgi:hypothetical protein